MIIDEIVDKLDIVSFFAKHGVNVIKNKNVNCEGSCPFCQDEKHFSFNQENGKWKCWKCGESGGVSGFLQRLLNCTSNEARKILCEEVSIIEDRVMPSQQNKTSNKTSNKSTVKESTVKESTVPAANRIYTRVCELLPLTDIHRQQLKKKRGFNDGLIDELMFRSLGPHTAILKNKLAQEFTEGDLLESGVLVKAPGDRQVILNNQLLEDNILIPYFNISLQAEAGKGEAGKGGGKNVIHIRPHKLGFEKISPQVYCRYLLQKFPNVEHIVLTEGEYKAAALYQWRIPAVAVPGVSSFGVKHLEKLVTFLREFEIKKVTVVFDNEIKDNPEYPNYKPKASDRYDTQLWAYLMAYKLGREGFEVKVGQLPDEWRQQGKVDFDGALAQGRTREDVLQVIARAKPPREFLDDLDEEARRIVQRKVSQHFARLNIRREFNRYVVIRYRGGESYEEVISNFVINIKSSFFTPEGVVRNIQLVNEHAETSDMFALEPADMAGLNEFKKFCFAAGNYIFEGRGEDLNSIWKMEFARDSGEFIVMPEKIGAIKKKMWMFDTVTIKSKKDVFRPDNTGAFWIDGKGYKPRPLTVERRD